VSHWHPGAIDAFQNVGVEKKNTSMQLFKYKHY
jgi:hypothetical protein